MRIALVHDYLNQFGGGERVLLSLMKLFPDAPVYTLLYDKEKLGRLFSAGGGSAFGGEGRVKKTSFLDFPLARRHHRWFIPLMPLAIRSMDLGSEYDLIISDSHGFSKGIAYDRAKTKHISYIHTPLRYAWETASYFGNSWYSKLFAFVFWPAFVYLRAFDKRAAQKPDILLANSNYIAGKIKKYYNREATVVYPPISDLFFRHSEQSEESNFRSFGKLQDDKQYYLALGRFLEYKRFNLIIDACVRGNFNLKIVGEGRLKDELKKLAFSSPRIEFLPFQSDEKLRDLYAGAKAFIMANEEDFGMVMAEAQACGTPVIAYGRGGALEIVEDGKTGVLFSQQTSESLLEAIRKFSSEGGSASGGEISIYDRAAISQSAERFSEENFQKGIEEAIKKVA